MYNYILVFSLQETKFMYRQEIREFQIKNVILFHENIILYTFFTRYKTERNDQSMKHSSYSSDFSFCNFYIIFRPPKKTLGGHQLVNNAAVKAFVHICLQNYSVSFHNYLKCKINGVVNVL